MSKKIVNTEFGKNVRQVREFLGLTIDDLAKRSGLTPAAISQIETGKRDPQLNTVISIANGLGASIERLINGVRK